MTKLILVLLGSFWLSCGNTPKTEMNTSANPSIENENVDAVVLSTDSLSLNKVDEEIVVFNKPSKEEKEVKKPSPEKEEVIIDKEPSESTAAVALNTQSEEKDVLKPDHSRWTTLLAKYVDAKGDVDYKGFQNEINALVEYLDYLAAFSPVKNWTKTEKLAYYINLYNAATVKLIIDNYPLKSIKAISSPWGKKWVNVGGKKFSLGNIEHKILRKMD